MFQPSRGVPQGVLTEVVSKVKKYMSGCRYQITKQRVVRYVVVGLICAFEKICQML